MHDANDAAGQCFDACVPGLASRDVNDLFRPDDVAGVSAFECQETATAGSAGDGLPEAKSIALVIASTEEAAHETLRQGTDGLWQALEIVDVTSNAVDIGVNRRAVCLFLQFMHQSFRLGGNGECSGDGVSQHFRTLPGSTTVTEEHPFACRQVDRRTDSRNGVSLDRDFGDYMCGCSLSSAAGSAEAVDGPFAQHAMRHGRNSGDLVVRDSSEIHVCVIAAGRECAVARDLGQTVRLLDLALLQVDVVDLGPVGDGSLEVHEEVSQGVGVVWRV